MNNAQPARIDCLREDRLVEIAAALAERDPSDAARRSRSGSTSAYALGRSQPDVGGVVVGTTAVASMGTERAVAHR